LFFGTGGECLTTSSAFLIPASLLSSIEKLQSFSNRCFLYERTWSADISVSYMKHYCMNFFKFNMQFSSGMIVSTTPYLYI